MLRALPFASTPAPDEEFKAFVLRVARNLQADRIRASAARSNNHVEHAIDLVREALSEGDTRDVNRHLSSVLLRLIKNRLPTQHFAILNHRVCGGRSFADISQIIGIPAATVQRRFREAIEVLRLELMREAQHDALLREILSREGFPIDHDQD